jgi:ESS family glutamate:Na+ symporter
MNSAMLTQLLYCFCVLSALLLAGTLLRGIVPIFQKLFLPASVIGGFIGLLAGPIIWKAVGFNGGIPFPQEWISTWSALPGILIVPVVASTALGARFGSNGLDAGKNSANVIKMFSILFVAGSVQVLLGLIVREVFVHIRPELGLYKPFGYELTEGFAGGHGTAAVIGNYYKGQDTLLGDSPGDYHDHRDLRACGRDDHRDHRHQYRRKNRQDRYLDKARGYSGGFGQGLSERSGKTEEPGEGDYL